MQHMPTINANKTARGMAPHVQYTVQLSSASPLLHTHYQSAAHTFILHRCVRTGAQMDRLGGSGGLFLKGGVKWKQGAPTRWAKWTEPLVNAIS